jgi:hypothetical protein
MNEERFAWGEETKHSARQSIMFFVLQFCTTRPYNRGRNHFISDFNSARIGDLVILESVRGWTKWCIGWLREVIPHESGFHRFCIESLEDGELCNWENVELAYLNREVLAERPEWRWTDRQFNFARNFKTICREHYFSPCAMPPVFTGFGVELSMRCKFDNSISNPEHFPDFREITEKMIVEFINRTKEKLNGRNRD